MKITKRLATIIFSFAVVLTTCPVSTAMPAFADELESLTSGGTIVTGDYRLDSDLTTPIKVKSFNSVTIDLNGHKITTAGTAIENEGNWTGYMTQESKIYIFLITYIIEILINIKSKIKLIFIELYDKIQM